MSNKTTKSSSHHAPSAYASRYRGIAYCVFAACLSVFDPFDPWPFCNAQEVVLSSPVQTFTDTFPSNIRLGIRIEDGQGNVIQSVCSNESFASASAIKTALLVELFSHFSADLDKSPRSLENILADEHPAVAHFSPRQREEIRIGLGGATVRRIGRVMMGSDAATNLVYNAAANVTIALLGSPDECTHRIHARSPELGGLVVRRYMLATRNKPGDNTATPRSMSVVWQWLAKGTIPGIDATTFRSIDDAILKAQQRHGIRASHCFKDGALDSMPKTRVYAGRFSRNQQSWVYVVMLEQSDSKTIEPKTESVSLEALALKCTAIALSTIE